MRVTVWDTNYSSSTTVTISVLDVNDNPPEVEDYDFDTFVENDASHVGIIQKVSNKTT